MANFYDITFWNEKPWFQTGGTRNKVIVEDPSTSKVYYFKTSLKKKFIDYKYEFWSEIIASEIGITLGFNMLKYDIAFDKNDEIGCLSESMVTEGKNKLTEGIAYLTGFDTTYDPDDKMSKKAYSFQLIQKSLKYFHLLAYLKNIIQVIIFDSIIGNGDRHQENWGFITEYNEVIKLLKEISKKTSPKLTDRLLFRMLAITSKANRDDPEQLIEEYQLRMPSRFSLIYDSGSCLGRELSSEKIKQMLNDNSLINSYIRKGKSEIHWEGKKINHFKLIGYISLENKNIVVKTIKVVLEKFRKEEVRAIVENIDMNLPEVLNIHKLPNERKELIIKLITLRIEELGKLIK